MVVGKSRRIVIDVDDVDLKRRLHVALAKDGVSLKDWFVGTANAFLRTREYDNQVQLPMFRVAEPTSRYGLKEDEEP